MNSKTLWVTIGAVIIIAIAWFSLDHRYRQVIPSDATQASTSSSTPATSASDQPAASNSGANSNPATTNQTVKNLMHTITIKTAQGTIVFETYDADAPKTVQNFITLANKGFYNGTIFHRVIEGFMIQGGDPTGTGRGGPGYTFNDELNPNTESYSRGYVRGTVAMANAGPNTNGSQFFIMQADQQLPHNYTIFGKVISGMDVVDAIAKAQTGANDRPVAPVKMDSVTVAETK